MTSAAIRLCRETIAQHSKSFALASRLLPPACRDDAAVVYAWCRGADDAVDLAARDQQPQALARLRAELRSVYEGQPQSAPVLAAFQEVAQWRRIPREYPEELLAGMEMDAKETHYLSLDQLLLYCYRVAGTVGLMMCHVMGVREACALRHGAHLGMAMQLTNICRDVLEDWERGRLYVPEELLVDCGAAGLRARLGGPLGREAQAPLARAVEQLLLQADRFYRSGDVGMRMLSWRCALAVRTARLVYSRIGHHIARHEYDVFAGRAYVPLASKLMLVLRAALRAPADLSADLGRRFSSTPLVNVVRFPTDVLPV
jgi:phytoene synthase